MKKTISLIVALVMVFAMCVPAFAAEKPTGTPADGAELGAYYAELLNADGADITAIAGEIVADFQSGVITVDTLPDVLSGIASNAVDQEAAVVLINAVLTELENLNVTLPDVTMPDVTLPEGTDAITLPDTSLPTLPDDGSEGEGDGFLDSVLGILNNILDWLLNPDADGNGDDPEFPTETTTQPNAPSGEGNVPNTGNTTLASVTAVAIVAGAAFILTRKKSDDAE